MTGERRRILDMLTERRITAEEADRLLGTLEAPPSGGAATTLAARPKYLRVMVEGTDKRDGGPLHVNLRIPIVLLRAGVRLATFLPPQAQQRVNEALRARGLDVDVGRVKAENLNELIDHLRDLSVDIDHTSIDPERKRDDVKVKIFVE